jgi:uncharacterized membrane protein YsdA (DUF1294 family)
VAGLDADRRRVSALVVAGSLAHKFSPLVAGFYFALSTLTYLFYRIDKEAARKGRWRTEEATLHILALIGGWPGALIAQGRLRHKNRKPSFQLAFRTTVLVNCAALFWLHSAAGGMALRTIMGGAG